MTRRHPSKNETAVLYGIGFLVACISGWLVVDYIARLMKGTTG